MQTQRFYRRGLSPAVRRRQRRFPFMRGLLICLLLLTGCHTQIQKPPYLPHRSAHTYRAIPVRSNDEIDYPSSGFYYRLKFMSSTQPIEHIDLMLSDLYSRGFNVTQAWYRSPTSHNRTIISAFLVIRLSERNPDMERFNFEEIQTPRGGRGGGVITICVPDL